MIRNYRIDLTDQIICGDALQVLKTLPDSIVNCCITSPPYYALRDYGTSGQIGQEETPGEYIARLVEVFREVRRVLRDDGTLWLNIADCYAAYVPKCWPQEIKTKDMLGIPWALAFALRADGWYLRSDIIWHKTNAMPHNAKDRPVSAYEHVFLLSKQKKYYFNYEALQVPVAESTIVRTRRGFKSEKYREGVPGQSSQAIHQPRPGGEAPALRRGRDVWSLGTNSYHHAHFATYPVELVKPCVLAGCSIGGTVLDPFFGSGTTGLTARMLDRLFIGIDISPDNCRMAEDRIAKGA